jgi:nucleoside-diphosphate-sugar epimerase
LNYLFARIARSESFTLWRKASRNIIDVNDMAAIARQLVLDNSARNVTLNVASTTSYLVTDIVAALERLVGKNAVYTVIDRGSEYPIDVSATMPFLEPAGVMFGNDYLKNLIHRYYEKAE